MANKITEHAFEYGGNKYFRGNAHNITLGCFGEKKDPIGAKAHLDVQNRIDADKLATRVRYNTTASIDWSDAKKGDVEVNGSLKIFGIGIKAAVKGDYNKARSAKLKLMSFAIDEGKLKSMLNTDAGGARYFLAKEGADGRVCSEVWVVAEGELAEHFDNSTSVTVGVNAAVAGLEVTASGGKAGSQTILLEEGVTFAYKLHKVKDWQNGKAQIGDMEADFKGMN